MHQVAQAGFGVVAPTDSWLRIPDLGLVLPAISTARRRVIDHVCGRAHLAYSHQVIDCAAKPGVDHVSVGQFGGDSSRHAKSGGIRIALQMDKALSGHRGRRRALSA